MRIDETPFQRVNLSAGISKVHRVIGAGTDSGLDGFDLSFIDLLEWGAESAATETVKPEEKPPVKSADRAKASEKAEKTEAKSKSAESAAASTDAADIREMVRKELVLLNTDLGANDARYLKEAVIPGLPMLIGSVPLDQVFPKNSAGEISYRGFDVSKPLADLIEKGMKTGRPIRVELDRHSSVVLKIKNGQVSAEFLSNDQAAALYIKQELDELRSRLAAKNLPVGTLEYRGQSRQNQSKGNQDQNPGSSDSEQT